MEELVKNIGLDTNETKVYMALLELGSATVTEVSKKAAINRTTGYDVLERLAVKGIVGYASTKGTKIKYRAEHPSVLINFLERQQKSYSNKLAKLKKQLPELEFLFKQEKKPQIKFFEGIEGVEQIYAETLKSKEEILSVGDTEEWAAPDLVAWGKNYNRERARLKIQERILLPYSKKTLSWFENYPTTLKYTQYRILPKDIVNYLFYSEINIYEDKVMIALLKKPHRMGVLITSQEFANILKAMFEVAWIGAKEYKPKKKTSSTKLA